MKNEGKTILFLFLFPQSIYTYLYIEIYNKLKSENLELRKCHKFRFQRCWMPVACQYLEQSLNLYKNLWILYFRITVLHDLRFSSYKKHLDVDSDTSGLDFAE